MKRARAMLMQQERLERKIAAGGTLRRRATGTEAGTAEATAKAPEEAFDVGDIFQILNADGDAGGLWCGSNGCSACTDSVATPGGALLQS